MTVAVTREHNYTPAGRFMEAVREPAPKLDRPKPFVEEYHRRQVGVTRKFEHLKPSPLDRERCQISHPGRGRTAMITSTSAQSRFWSSRNSWDQNHSRSLRDLQR